VEVFVLSSKGWLTGWRVKVALVAGLVVLTPTACSQATAERPRTAMKSASGSGAPTPEAPLVRQLAGKVSDARAMKHLHALQRIADEHGGNRAAGTSGYDASVDYVVGVLQDDGFEVRTPSFQSSAGAGGPQRNVIAQTRTGDPRRVVMIGAHLDSVEHGPGIVDNGSGVATLLEIASRLGPRPSVRNAVRFAFFGGEETGAEGSTGYLRGLSANDRKRIQLYLNVDMVASPNGGYFAQGGAGRTRKEAGPPGSATIARVLADELVNAGAKAPEIIEFVGDDESPFIAAGIPVGGAENGDAGHKTGGQVKSWGGQAGEHYDPCYHQACDTVANVNRDLLAPYLRALAGALAHFASEPSGPSTTQ
jgi:aminopeptidase S